MPDVFTIFRSECVDDIDVSVTALEPNKESMTAEPWHRLFPHNGGVCKNGGHQPNPDLRCFPTRTTILSQPH